MVKRAALKMRKDFTHRFRGEGNRSVFQLSARVENGAGLFRSEAEFFGAQSRKFPLLVGEYQIDDFFAQAIVHIRPGVPETFGRPHNGSRRVAVKSLAGFAFKIEVQRLGNPQKFFDFGKSRNAFFIYNFPVVFEKGAREFLPHRQRYAFAVSGDIEYFKGVDFL